MSSSAPTVFVVDDNLSFLTAVSRLFRASGFVVKAYSSAEEFLTNRPPDAAGCVVADLQMPGMDGIELQGALVETPNPLPIIFLTGQGDIPTTVSAMRQGAEDFLTKQSPKEELLAAVRRALARDAMAREYRWRQLELQNRFAQFTQRDREAPDRAG
jgi:two-component system, LuxR family, response regulator FixJ